MAMDKKSKVNIENQPEKEAIDQLLMEEAAAMSLSDDTDESVDDDLQEITRCVIDLPACQIPETAEASPVSPAPATKETLNQQPDEKNGKTELKKFADATEISQEEFLQPFASILSDDAVAKYINQLPRNQEEGRHDAVSPEIQRRSHVKKLLVDQKTIAGFTSKLRQQIEEISSNRDAIGLSLKRQNAGWKQSSCCKVRRRAQACAREDKKMKMPVFQPRVSIEMYQQFNTESIYPTFFQGASSSTKEQLMELLIWRRPSTEWIKLNTCGMSRKVVGISDSKVSIGNVEAAACGGVIRDSNGNPLLSFVKQLDKVPAYTAKCMGLYHGILMILSLPDKVNKVWIECDSRELVHFVHQNQLEGMAIFKLLQEFEHWRISFVEDNGNRLAAGIVSLGMETGDDMCIHGDVPPPLRWLIQLDLLIEDECVFRRSWSFS